MRMPCCRLLIGRRRRPRLTMCASNQLQVGGLIKRLDTGEGSYAKELEEDYDVADQLDQVGDCGE